MFDNIIGNNKIKEILKNSVIANKVSHSYMFIGIDGIGKKMIANEFAKAILCINDQNDRKLCNICKSCTEFDSNNNPDYIYLEPSEKSIKIEDIRKLQEKIYEKPIVSNKKVYIINDADKMTREAQNCLLKTLEEPPEFAILILIGTNENDFLTTIKSRCSIIKFDRLTNEEINKYLEKTYIDNNMNNNIDLKNELIINMFEGSIGKAIKLKDKQEEYLKIKEFIDGLENVHYGNIIMKISEIFGKYKDEIFDILDYINVILIDKIRKDTKYSNCISYVEDTKKRLKQNANYDMSIDNMILKIWGDIN